MTELCPVDEVHSFEGLEIWYTQTDKLNVFPGPSFKSFLLGPPFRSYDCCRVGRCTFRVFRGEFPVDLREGTPQNFWSIKQVGAQVGSKISKVIAWQSTSSSRPHKLQICLMFAYLPCQTFAWVLSPRQYMISCQK